MKIDSWAQFFRTFHRLTFTIEENLKKNNLPSLEIYDVLWTLENESNHQMRLHELASKLFVARFNITRIIQRMEKDGYIQKLKCPQDQRGFWAKLTPKGLKMRKKIWSIYGHEINHHYSSQLLQKEHQEIIFILKKLEINQIDH